MRIENSGIPYTYNLTIIIGNAHTNRHGTPCTNAITFIYMVHMSKMNKNNEIFDYLYDHFYVFIMVLHISI